MNVLVIGSGGREHTLVWKLNQSSKVDKIYAMPGNGGTAKIAENLPGNVNDFFKVKEYVNEKAIDLVVVGPEDPLVGGIVDSLAEIDVKVFGPNKIASQFEGSKEFSKIFMEKHNLPTAFYEQFEDYDLAVKYLDTQEFPVVVKADGLAAGKGVTIAYNKDEAVKALKDSMIDNVFGSAGSSVVIEEFLVGEEASILAFVDANTIVPMVPAQDHKAIFDGDKGPNTGGMGTYSPAPVVDKNVMAKIKTEVLDRFMIGCKAEGIVFRGILFVGLMIKDGIPKVLEFNVRFGDPETQVVLPRLDSDLYDIMEAVATDRLADVKIKWKDDYAVCVVLSSGGYPGNYEKGKEITGLDSPDVMVFHAGTKAEGAKLISSGGRVLGVTALGKTLPDTIKKAYEDVGKIDFTGKYFRKDIGKKALKYL